MFKALFGLSDIKHRRGRLSIALRPSLLRDGHKQAVKTKGAARVFLALLAKSWLKLLA